MSNAPLGIRFLQKHCFNCDDSPNRKNFGHRVFILFFTFICYVSYHLSRKPISVVKSVLHRNCSPPQSSSCTNWKPFDSDNYEELLGSLDSAFLFSYAFGMFISGHIAERMNLRWFLASGMILSGLFTILFGMAFFWKIHALAYFLTIQIVGGLIQSSGWPSVVTCIGNWFGKGKRGLIFGIWNSHTSVGNILGSLIAAEWVNTKWGLSFIFPGLIIASVGILVFFFLVVKPEDINCQPPDHHTDSRNLGETSSTPLFEHRPRIRKFGNQYMNNKDPDITVELSSDDVSESLPIIGHPHLHIEHKPITFCRALRIPGVVEFSMCLFFAKLVSYTFLYWLPKYIQESTNFDPEKAADLSTLFDAGGILGGIIAGVISDYTGSSATTCMIMLMFSAPMLKVYNDSDSQNLTLNVALLVICGLLVNGPYALITTAVSTELGTHSTLRGNAKALATVTAIIDGTGSMGAALGPLLAGLVSSNGRWQDVFYMLIGADILALLFLSRLVIKEIKCWLISYQLKRRHIM